MNWKISLISLFGILCIAGNLRAQSVVFLGITPDARSASLGAASVALSPDAWSVSHNVAGAAMAASKAAIAYGFTPWMKDYRTGSRLHAVGGFWRLDPKSAIVAGFRHFANGTFDLYDEYGKAAGTVNPYEYTLEAGYARLLCQGFSAGATIRYIRSDLGELLGTDPANAVAFDLGIYYRREFNLFSRKSMLTGGLTVVDLGSRIKYNQSGYALPARINGGVALKSSLAEQHQITLSGQVAYRIQPSDSRTWDGGIGIEYACYQIGFLRAGYHWSDIEKNAGGDYFSLGIGVAYWHFFADASWRLATEKYDPLDKTFTLSAGVSF